MAYSKAANIYAEEQRHELFMRIIKDLRKCDLEEVSRLTKRWGKRGVAVPTLYTWIGTDAPVWPHFRTICAVAEALGYELRWWAPTSGLPKNVLRLRRVK